jgi:predicted Zn-dependent protease
MLEFNVLLVNHLKGEKNGVKELKGAGVYGLHGWAMLEQKLGKWSKARELLARAAKIQPGNAVVHQTRALLEARVHNYAAARYHFRIAVELAPEDVKCWQVSKKPFLDIFIVRT